MITEPIKDTKELKSLINFYNTKKPNTRNYCLIVLGLNTALRISDILSLKWNMIYDFSKKKFKNRIVINEKKTGKTNIVPINKKLLICLQKLFLKLKPQGCDYLFTKHTDRSRPLNRTQAYRIVKQAANECNLTGNISCHSLRKTFGFFAWKQGTQPALLMAIYNHSSYNITQRYLGITQLEKDAIYMNIHFPN
jgi:integrase